MKLAKLGDGPEIFHTIQGEGVSAGSPAVFVRTSRCNLHCVWCDTDYTWNFTATPWPHQKNHKHDKNQVTVEATPAEIAKLVAAYSCPRVVLTGGEPLLQQPELLETIRLIRKTLPDCLFVFEVETNGTIIPDPDFNSAIDQFNVSPKLANSGVPENQRLNPAALTHFAASPNAWFKFVVASPNDLEEIQTILKTHHLPASRTLLMPEGRTNADLNRNAPWLADCCRDLGLRFCDRLHIRLWGDKRGV
ncbi:MAG: 7-carboxy-7-deazaguanine synthase QueE [Verrucomicrobiales bacterium]|nr:7-carboxy-7-deazaguanine synthase QueE [Verrucomicrobiota bacterium JB025]